MSNLSGSQEFVGGGSATVTFPPGVVCYEVEAWGGGGGGGGGGGTSGSAGSGGGAGGSGGYVRSLQTTTSGAVTIVVGAGGAGGAAAAGGGAFGGDGAASTVTDGGTVTVSAPGGSGGHGGASTNPLGSATPGGAGGSGGSVAVNQGFIRSGMAGGAASGVTGGSPGGYPGAGVLPAVANTGGPGGHGSSPAFGGAVPASGPSAGANGNHGQVLLSWFVQVPWPGGGQPIQVFSGTSAGQTIDSRSSYAFVDVAPSGALVYIRLAQTNLPNQQFHAYYKLDTSAPIDAALSFGTDSQGNGGAVFEIGGLAAGAHTLTVEINLSSAGQTYYVTSGSNGIPFTC